MRPDYPAAIWRPAAATNYGERPAGMAIDCVVLHATAGSLSATLGWFANPQSGVSAHYVVAKTGRVYQMVEEQQRAFHAGIPFNPQAAFAKYAREHNLGAPQTDEFDFSHRGVAYRGQGFGRAIVYARVGDWGNIRESTW